jgi:hypothetical protein
MQDLLEKAKNPQTNLSEVIQEFLSLHGDAIRPARKFWLECEVSGYKDAIDYYLREPVDRADVGFIAVRPAAGRQTPGTIKALKADGTHADVDHAIARRNEYFVSIPIGYVQELAQFDGTTSVFELPELTAHIGAGAGGPIVLLCQKTELERIVRGVRMNVVSAIDLTLHPEKQEQADQRSESMRKKGL